MVVVFECCRAYIALQIATARTSHLVTSELLDELLLAFVARPHKRGSHRLLNFVTAIDLVVLRVLLAGDRYM